MSAKVIFKQEREEKPRNKYMKTLANNPTTPRIITRTVGFSTYCVRMYLSIIFTTAKIKAARIEKNIQSTIVKLIKSD